MAIINYNERSWAIDLITEINLFLKDKKKKVRYAGGESTIKSDEGRLFPDVLLFGNETYGEILQGWELKFPDTQINDTDLIGNASLKAELLNLDSFLIWNAREAILYRKESNEFKPFKSWQPIADINQRADVLPNDQRWKDKLYEIVNDLCEFFSKGDLKENTIVQSLSLNSIIDIILENTNSTSENIKLAITEDAVLDAEINRWWRSSSYEYPDNNDRYSVLSRVIITDWFIKIVFAHVLKKYFDDAKAIMTLQESSSPNDGVAVMNNISEHCNFWNIFSANIGQTHISRRGWNQLLQLNGFLSKLNIESIDVKMLHEILQTSVVAAKRKGAGQYSTPQKLSELLARITIDNKTKTVMDPCCGTGTIISEVYSLKKEYGISESHALNNIWASDKYAFPLQLATLTLTKPENVGRILQIFRHDVIQLSHGMSIFLKDPTSGKTIKYKLPLVDYFVSNLPFVQQEDIKFLNPEIRQINEWISKMIGENAELPGRSDLYAYIPFYLYRLLSSDGKLGLVLSNAWMGTDYGSVFIDYLQLFFEFETIVISGAGRWFQNADIVTTLVVLKKKAKPGPAINNKSIVFCTLKENLENIESIKELAENIHLKQTDRKIDIIEHTQADIKMFKTIGLTWSSFFADMKSVLGISDKLIAANELFDINRGERRGWNQMFYPQGKHRIENEFIRPVLKNLRNCESLVCESNKIAFCCPDSIVQLKANKKTGALRWIKKFEKQFNERGIPLPEALKRDGVYWYEMSPNTLADYVANINYDRSLFFARLKERSFVDQRLIRFTIKEETKNDCVLLHALLNSVISMFFLESLGFGRGLGALDLSASKLNQSFKILNPNIINKKEQQKIIKAFQPLVHRPRYPLEKELKEKDRQIFEKILFSAFDISEYLPIIENEVVKLQHIRLAAIH